ncbi:putative colanic acid biosynthesis acetyltransferase [Sphingomonas naphthae]|uniref:Colanic acid biosynthesis acetyltransferase n=1 Tax=Sphingomonas naphthae TaxID=1813468 RepID=A0ABY7TNQ1_9SPHN|nr:putative colanic acid biosynthesis acetyltransferase [Sphingomonas naphthae]WCT73479.1 putative colanic acid biosynthesis acetyltransferase [Sphingomonas naphthae]
MTILDARKTRPSEGGPSFSLANRLTRLAWIVTWLLLARWTPKKLNGWRCFLARRFGAKVAPGAMIYGSVRIWLPSNLTIGTGSSMGPGVNCYSMGAIHIGRDTIVSQGAHLCAGTHDFRDPHFQIQSRPIHIGDRVWIAAEAFVAPGCVIPDGVVLGARGCAVGRLRPWTIYGGNPARPLGERVLRAE